MQVKSVGTLTKILVNNPPPPPPQAMLSFDDQTHIYTRKTNYLHLSTLYWRGGERGDYAQIVLLNDSLTIFTSVPTTFDLHCTYIESFLTIFGQCINVLNYNNKYSTLGTRSLDNEVRFS